jgi:predicted CXXCH cytochrome family protein
MGKGNCSGWLKVLFVLSLASVFMLMTGSQGNATIVGSDHDFSGENWSGGEICIVCHTPHNADTTVTDAPLWNHEVTTATYTLYDSPTLDSTPEQPSGASRLCLSCHDGTVAIDSYGGNTGSDTISGPALIGTDLSDDHPISITYDSTLATADGELEDPSTISPLVLFNSKLECATCHDVHATNTYDELLRISNDASALCLKCHAK